MMIVYPLSVFFILIISNDLSEASINTSVIVGNWATMELPEKNQKKNYENIFIVKKPPTQKNFQEFCPRTQKSTNN